MTADEAAAFIRANLALAPAPGLPAIRLFVPHPGSGLRRLDAAAAPYWAFPWPGGLALAQHVRRHGEAVAGRRVLDFGCGGGLVAIAAAQAGAAAVWAFDSDPLARVAATLNAEANGVALTVPADLAAVPDAVDIVLAGDVFYSAAVARRTTAQLRRFRAGGAAVLVGDPGRRYLPHAFLREVARHPVSEFGGGSATGIVFAFEPAAVEVRAHFARSASLR